MSRPIHPITMPKWGIEMQEGTVTTWHAGVGQKLNKNDPLLDIETQKIVNTVESPIDGTLRRIIADVGETHGVGRLLGIYADTDVSDAAIDDFIKNFGISDGSTGDAAGAPAVATAPVAEALEGEARISPIARRLAEKLGVDLTQVKGSGRNGRVSKEDVEAFFANQGTDATPKSTPSAASAPAAAPTNTSTREKLSSMRATIARRLLESKQGIPHYRLAIDVDVSALLARRQRLKSEGHRVSVNDLLVRACAVALVRHPDLNATLEGEEVVRYSEADICVAVATDNGLITPIVRAANRKSILEIAAAVQDLSARASAGKLVKEDIAGGTFTISNLGMFGVDRFDAIINPPQVAILAVGAASDRVVVKNGAPAVSAVVALTLSCDHRVVDGAVGAKFLATLRELLETPDSL